MLYFNPQPDYIVLSKYYQLPQAPQQMLNDYADGFPIVIDWYYTDEKVAHIENEFKSILSKYDLSYHYDNLLFLTLSKLQYTENVISELLAQYTYKKRVKELASLLLTFKRTPNDNLGNLQLKTFVSTVKVADSSLLSWIGQLLGQVIEQGKYPISLLGIEPEQWYDHTPSGKILNFTKLEVTAKTNLPSPIKSINSYYADLCLSLYPYLIHETSIKPDASTLISDKMKYFFFDLLVLFNLVDPDKVESESKDYIGTLLRNRLNQLNHSLSRK